MSNSTLSNSNQAPESPDQPVSRWRRLGVGLLLLVTILVVFRAGSPVVRQRQLIRQLRSRGFAVATQALFGLSSPDPRDQHWWSDLGAKSLVIDSGSAKCTDEDLANIVESIDLLYDAGPQTFSAVTISSSEITDRGLSKLQNATRLIQLRIDSEHITDAGLKHLRNLTNLTDLVLRARRIQGAGLEHLSGLHRLASLRLDHTSVDDDSLRHLIGHNKLGILSLRQTRVTSLGMEHLKPFSHLQFLGLGQTRVTDDGLVDLQSLPQLRQLELDQTLITDSGLAVLAGFPALQTVHLSGTLVTKSGVEQLLRDSPKLALLPPSFVNSLK